MPEAIKTPSRHGLRAIMAKVKVRGLGVLDRRTAAARTLIARKANLLRDLGGEENISAQKLVLVEHAVRTELFIDHIDGWLLEQPTLINKKKRSLLPVLNQRQALIDSHARLLSQLGLERVPKPLPTLKQYVQERDSSP